jgi:hypothetical protein
MDGMEAPADLSTGLPAAGIRGNPPVEGRFPRPLTLTLSPLGRGDSLAPMDAALLALARPFPKS